MTTQKELEAFLEDATDTCLTDLFEAHGLPLAGVRTLSAPPEERYALGGCIGFVGDTLRGSVLVLTGDDVLKASHPVKATDPASLHDWLGEISNQLIGRVKNRLLTQGVSVALSTPTVLVGEAISPADRTDWIWHQATTGSGSIAVALRANPEPGFAFEEAAASDVQAEGEVLLF